jgi:hypothetical protein
MKTLTASLLLALCATLSAQDAPKKFDWVRANNEIIQLDPGDSYSARVYRPGPDGGNMHVIIQSGLPVTVAMVPAEQWNYSNHHPEAETQIEYLCMREHITSTTYDCHLPPNQHMELVLFDERRTGHAIMHGIGAVIDPRVVRKFASPNAVQVTYHSWSCVANCLEPEFQWVLLSREKYQVSSTPKMYSVSAIENDGQKLWVRIKAQVPMTLAVLPSALADQVYAQPDSLNSVLAQTTCKQRGVQKMEFNCNFNISDGPQALLILPEPPVHGGKKAEIEVQTYKCVNNCNLLVSNTPNQ